MDPDAVAWRKFSSTGERAAASEVFRRHANLLYTVALRILGNTADAEEVTQDVFVKALAAAGAWRGECPVKNWLLKIVFNLSLNRKRERHRRGGLLERYRMETKTPALEAQLLEAQPALEQAITELEPELQAAVLLHYYDHKPQTEIAEFLGCSQRTVQYRLQQALEKLRGIFQRQGHAALLPILPTALQQSALTPAPAALLGFLETQLTTISVSAMPLSVLTGLTKTASIGGSIVMNIKVFAISTAAVAALCLGTGFVASNVMSQPKLQQQFDQVAALQTDLNAAKRQWQQLTADAKAEREAAAEARLAADRLQCDLTASQNEKEAAVAAKQAAKMELEKIKAENVELAARAMPAAASDIAAAEPVKRKKKNPMANLAKMMDDPKVKEMVMAQQKSIVDMMYKDLADMLQLSPEDREAFMKLAYDNQVQMMELGMRAMSDLDSPEAMADMKARMDAFKLENEDGMRKLLGGSYSVYEGYRDTLPERQFISSFTASLPGGMDSQRREQIVNIMHEERASHPLLSELNSLNNANGPTDPTTMSAVFDKLGNKDYTAKLLEQQKKYDETVAQRVQPMLSREEHQQFVTSQNSQRSMMEMGINMMSNMFGGGDEDIKETPPSK